MKLHLPYSLRRSLLLAMFCATMTLPGYADDTMPMATTAEWVLSKGSITLGAEGTTLLYSPEQNKSVTTNGYVMQYVDVNRIDVLAGSHNIVEVNEGGMKVMVFWVTAKQ